MSSSDGSKSPAPALASGEHSVSAALEAMSIFSVTRAAPQAITPKPMPGKMAVVALRNVDLFAFVVHRVKRAALWRQWLRL